MGGIDILINNAVIRKMSPVAELGDADWDRAIEVNLSAPFRLIRACLPGMQQRGWGRIVNMASVYSLIALADRVDYVTTKHAMIGLTRTVALELAATRITCNAICPGLMATDSALARIDALAAQRNIGKDDATAIFLSTRQPGGRFIPMETVTALVLFLCGPQSEGINGAAIPVDNGWSFA
jgi:3-hydroxybutyrate dehydrogenase